MALTNEKWRYNILATTNTIFDNLMNYSSSNVAPEKKKMRPSERLLSDIEGYGFDLSELGGVLTTKGHQLIVSCAGSGKTTGLIFKIIYDLKSGRATRLLDVNNNMVRVPERIWVATFLKTGAEELASSFRRWEYKLHCADMSSAIQFSTLHAEFKRALNQLGVKTDIISDSDNEKLLRSVINNYGVKNSKGGKLSNEELSDLAGVLTYTRNRLDSTRYVTLTYTELKLTQTIIDSILFDWRSARAAEGKVDFEDLQEYLYMKCCVEKDKRVIDFISNRYSFIYIDEFQDTSQIQYAVLKVYATNCKQLVVIGDDDQTIYSWRGSDNSIITTDFMRDYNPVRSNLSTNFRCPANILNAIKPSIEKNTTRFDKNLQSHSEGGEVRIGEYAGYRQMAISLGDMVYKDICEGRNVAILCRVNSDGLMPAMFFDKVDRFSFSITGKGMTLDSYIGRLAMSIVKLFTNRTTSDVKKALRALVWDDYGINKLMDICKNNKCSIWTVDVDDLKYSCGQLADTLLDWREWRQSMGDIDALRVVLHYYRTEVFVKESQFNDVMKSVLLTFEALLDFQEYSSVDDFLYDLSEINERLQARVKKQNVQVRVATVHEFKGKEADSVYIWNDSRDVFPYKLSMDTLAEFEEERRIHYIACTRAKVYSTLMYIKNRRGQFVDEMDLSSATKIEGETSGVLGRALLGKMQEEKAKSEFEREVVQEPTEDDEPIDLEIDGLDAG